jgi:hypothetical protein
MNFIEKVIKEKDYQKEKWGEEDKKHSILEFAGLLSRYVGRLTDNDVTLETINSNIVKIASLAYSIYLTYNKD